MTITEEQLALGGDLHGVVHGMDSDDYHSHPALSSTEMRELLDCPARFHWNRSHPREDSKVFDLGRAAHRLVLGDGQDIVEIDAPDWRTKKAQEARRDSRESGFLPLLTKEVREMEAMAAALRRHPVAGPLFAPGTGIAEDSLFWRDSVTGVPLRARIDWTKNPVAGRRRVLAEYKSADRVDPPSVSRAVENYGYHQQCPHYLDGFTSLGLGGPDTMIALVFQERTAPYLVHVTQLNATAMQIGRAKNREAIRVYQECLRSEQWPGYGDAVSLTALPTWAENEGIREYLKR